MNKTSIFLIRNIWWLVPLSVVLLFWEHTAPILLMLVFAFLGRVILQPVVRQIEKLTGTKSNGNKNQMEQNTAKSNGNEIKRTQNQTGTK